MATAAFWGHARLRATGREGILGRGAANGGLATVLFGRQQPFWHTALLFCAVTISGTSMALAAESNEIMARHQLEATVYLMSE